MGEGLYFNFDLIIESAGKKYRARVIDSPAGHAFVKFNLPFSNLELENFILRMGKSRVGARRLNSDQMETAKQVGGLLFKAIFKETVNTCFQRSKDIALDQERGLRVRLRIDVPEFHCFPWEYLYDTQTYQFLALSRETPIVRYLELSYSMRPLQVKPPINILVMISCPEGYPQLDVEKEWENLNTALTPLISRGLVNLERLENSTISALQQHLRRGNYHIFHFIGHGSFLLQKQDGILLLSDEIGSRGRPVSGQYLGTILHDHRSLRLVVLNACEGACTSPEDPHAGIAQTLLRQGIPAVIAMQSEIFENAAITFAREFYGAIADGYPVDAAVSEARKAIYASGNDTEWGTPVLFMYSPNGKVFDLDRPQILKTEINRFSNEPVIEKPEKKGSLRMFSSRLPKKPPGFSRMWFVGSFLTLIIIFLAGYWFQFTLPHPLPPTTTLTYEPSQPETRTPTSLPSATNTAFIVPPAEETITVNYSPKNTNTVTPSLTPSSTPIPSEIEDTKGVQMVLIQAGEFIMGNDSGKSDEKPAHTVYLDSYYIDKYEVTNAHYKACEQKGNCIAPKDPGSFQRKNYYNDPKYSDYPVIHVDWGMAQTYCEWRGARLPTEAEWEKAARGMDERIYPWGNEADCRNANFRDVRCVRLSDTVAVFDFKTGQSFYGVFNMAGNVWEWVQDWYSNSYYREYVDFTTNTPPEGPPDGVFRVIRGGGFSDDWGSLYLSNREGRDPTSPAGHIGFRCVLPVFTDFP